MSEFGELAIGAVTVIPLIIGIVQFAKKFGLQGNILVAVSVGIGAFFGALIEVAEIYPEILPWIKVVVYGLIMGLAASGLYDLGKGWVTGARNNGD